MGLTLSHSPIHHHLLRASKRHNGAYTVTPTPRAAAARPKPKRGSPFGELILGPDAGAAPTAYKPIFDLV